MLTRVHKDNKWKLLIVSYKFRPTDIQHLQFGAHRGALGHLTSGICKAVMAAEREHQDELPQGSLVDHQEASTSEANSQIANLT
ncbi:hypothetical protein TIFTF001_031810 [Ficus carica]|uniref:Uncharacterized protein n=1 Tax=Ficus carica TaxID=3494 RepID=A0AA88DX81_FICCA|nr:hypothetical protein TIFTF001_031810 [Ficus carica]